MNAFSTGSVNLNVWKLSATGARPSPGALRWCGCFKMHSSQWEQGSSSKPICNGSGQALNFAVTWN